MTKSPKEAAAAAEEIRVLQEQMKEMQRRLDALCAEQPADVEDVENDESSSQDAEPVSGSVRAQPCSDQAEPWQDDAADACAPSEADGSDSDKAANGEGASHVSSEERPVNSPSVEPVSAPGETYAASCVSSQNAYCASEQTAYQPPVNPVSGYAAQQTQPFVSGAPVTTPPHSRQRNSSRCITGILQGNRRTRAAALLIRAATALPPRLRITLTGRPFISSLSFERKTMWQPVCSESSSGLSACTSSTLDTTRPASSCSASPFWEGFFPSA